jgi:hypothetical protein
MSYAIFTARYYFLLYSTPLLTTNKQINTRRENRRFQTTLFSSTPMPSISIFIESPLRNICGAEVEVEIRWIGIVVEMEK